MPSRKRNRDALESDEAQIPQRAEPSLLDRIRNMSEFAALNQYIFLFGKAMKIQDVEVEELEQACIQPTPSTTLAELGLALLKNVSSHRGLTLEIFEEYTRRQYLAKSPTNNPFGDGEEPIKFDDLDVFTRIRVLLQLSTWTFYNPDRMREKMNSTQNDELDWRMEPFGWDAQERTYYVLDDNRLYRQTDPPIPEPQKKKPKPRARTTRHTRQSKRQRISRVVESTPEVETEAEPEDTTMLDVNSLDYEENYEGRKWECIAITLEQYRDFIDSLKSTRDQDERNLRKSLETDVIPILLEQEEDRQRKELRRLRELENLQKMASAKRSSRIAQKQEAEREKEEAEEAERKRLSDLRMAQKEQAKQRRLEEDRESRMQTREQRLKEREVKRILHEEQLRKEEEQLKQLAEEEANGGASNRISHRQLKADVAKRQKELEDLQSQEEDWFFDCSVCGVHGDNMDDGTHIIACDKCNVWQHSQCHGIDKEQAERDDFTFVCTHCKKKAENPVPPIRIRLNSSPNNKRKEAQPLGHVIKTDPQEQRGWKPGEIPAQDEILPSREVDIPSQNGHAVYAHYSPPVPSGAKKGSGMKIVKKKAEAKQNAGYAHHEPKLSPKSEKSTGRTPLHVQKGLKVFGQRHGWGFGKDVSPMMPDHSSPQASNSPLVYPGPPPGQTRQTPPPYHASTLAEDGQKSTPASPIENRTGSQTQSRHNRTAPDAHLSSLVRAPQSGHSTFAPENGQPTARRPSFEGANGYNHGYPGPSAAQHESRYSPPQGVPYQSHHQPPQVHYTPEHAPYPAHQTPHYQPSHHPPDYPPRTYHSPAHPPRHPPHPPPYAYSLPQNHAQVAPPQPRRASPQQQYSSPVAHRSPSLPHSSPPLPQVQLYQNGHAPVTPSASFAAPALHAPAFPPPGSSPRPRVPSLHSSPAPSLPNPAPSTLPVGDPALKGSSPGYSPTKHSSPPRPGSSRQSFGVPDKGNLPVLTPTVVPTPVGEGPGKRA